MKNSFKAALLSLATLFAVACSGSADIDSQIRSAEAAIAQGDMVAARSVASNLLGNDNLTGIPASQLARLSIVYMQLADSDTSDSQSNVSTAAGLFRKAFEANADSAARFYNSLPPDKLPYARMLSTLVGNFDNPYDINSDTLDIDTLIHPFDSFPTNDVPI